MREEPFKHLLPGQQYAITQSFVDFDGKVYHPGTTCKYLGKNFLPYDDGLTLYFSEAGEVLMIRLQWREEAQKNIIEGLEDYFVDVDRS